VAVAENPRTEKIGVLLVNTGSSSAPRAKETRAYLRQFLSDPRIIDIAPWKRWLLLNLIILPLRPRKTAEAYEAIWTDRGSPLIAISEDFRDLLQKRLPEFAVEIGMAYGDPSVRTGMDKLLAQEVDRIIVVPMFPQFASATTGSVLEAAYKIAGEHWNVPALSALPAFYDDPLFIDAWEAVAKPRLEAFKPDHVLMSFHGLPERQVKKSDPTGEHCLCREGCCDVKVSANRNCYRHHCIETGKRIVERLGLAEYQYTVTFQSRLGRDPWLTPATDETIVKLAKQGVKRLAILSPAFVADCLETLEEIGIGGKEEFLKNGGEEYLLVPSLNTEPKWVEALARRVEALA
jgi:ferrochelatase